VTPVPAERPSPSVLRAISDETVARALIAGGRMTRAQLSAATGLSKPTVAESIRRLVDKGLVCDTGVRTTGRGGVGTYYELSETAGVGLTVAIAPEGIVVEVLDAAGSQLARAERDVDRPSKPAAVRKLLAGATRSALRTLAIDHATLAVVSAADPVDRATGRLVHLPDAPFLVGELDPTATLAAFVRGPVHVDNDVNWAARHEQAARRRGGESMDDFAYLYLGEGLGCAMVADGEVRRGHGGLAGEVSHVLTVGPGNVAIPFTAVFDRLRLRQASSAAIDLDAVTAAFERPRRLAAIAKAITGVISAIVALTNPSSVVLAGSWGTDPRLVDAVRDSVAEGARPVAIEPAREPAAASLAGARAATLDQLHHLITTQSRN
jgi:predicted NBD/HSP70 family sugar kinase